MRTYNWAIMGLGQIAHKFAESLTLLPNARLHAVASRTGAKAEEFAAQYGVPHAVGSYEELLTVPDVDVVYIATPHTEHYANTLLCLRAGLPVLCEKPFAVNTVQAQEMRRVAEEKGVFLMEAFWTRFFPAIHKALEVVASGTIGEVKHLAADFGFVAPYNPEGRLFNPVLAGGSLLDIGVYPLFISKLFLGEPQAIRAVATLADTGVDVNCAMALAYASGATASLFSTIAAQTDNQCILYGTQGQLHLTGRFHAASGIMLKLPNQEPQVIPCEKQGFGYHYEAEHVQQCLTQGLTQSPLLPLQFTQELMQQLDAIRQQIGLRYPMESIGTA
ncbi:Gfo/Idh/MocA family oxidoreductase [Hymenobacter taeanensis]|uniref:Gfo/Idh/MocA family oxidoreductase n=1 Tax=Hymenobacter taeanensis TaxID=2735321 RepID=A0A6M6BHY3_9BACT|nr:MULTISPECIES: Gfo/Idh/MocA family oxidoreductase [Hymenobacter]QJX47706.1 Gfo/Idh/MocA family oxidoreductase [Hymenobacter taeanensis]UOQ82810.1 Gfo/Idh/MocA family oxidoreductase [Hymenobacter sp. 5414T-23]